MTRLRNFYAHLKLALVLMLFLSIGCKKEQDHYWEVKTIDYSVDNDSIVFRGEIVSMGTSPAVGYGFHLSNKKEYSSYLYARETGTKGFFTYSMPDTIATDLVFFFKSFIESEGEKTYGEDIQMVGSKKYPKIDTFYPRVGKQGEYLKFQGKNLGLSKFSYEVVFGEIQAKVTQVSDNYILVKIPEYTTADSCQILIKIGESKIVTDEYFHFWGPKVNSIYPLEGNGKEINISINGTGFSEIPFHNIVTIGDKKAKVIKATKNQLNIEIDTREMPPGKHNVIVNANEIISANAPQFNVTTPWKRLAQFTDQGVRDAACFTIGDKIYIFGGKNNDGDYTNDNQLWEYDTKNDIWSRKKDLPSYSRSGSAAFSIGNKGYIGCGSTHELTENNLLQDFWEYDQEYDTWKRIADYPRPCESPVSAAFKGMGYVGMGYGNYYNRKSWWKYDPNLNTWTEIMEFPGEDRGYPGVSIRNGSLYLFGGYNENGITPRLWKYTSEDDSWTDMGTHRKRNVTFAISGENKCYVAYSYYVGSYENIRVYEYEIDQNQFHQIHSFPGEFRLWGANGVIIGNYIYFGFGGTNDYLNERSDFWSYPIN